MSTAAHRMTAEELFWLPDDGLRHELDKGKLVTMPLHGAKHGLVAMNLLLLLGTYVNQNSLGVLFGTGTGFKLESDPDTVLAPDLAFIHRERVGTISEFYYFGAPDLVAEILSREDRQSQIEERAIRWLDLGSQLVWLVDLASRTVKVHRPGRNKLMGLPDVLKGGDLVPDFQVPVASIFDYQT